MNIKPVTQAVLLCFGVIVGSSCGSDAAPMESGASGTPTAQPPTAAGTSAITTTAGSSAAAARGGAQTGTTASPTGTTPPAPAAGVSAGQAGTAGSAGSSANAAVGGTAGTTSAVAGAAPAAGGSGSTTAGQSAAPAATVPTLYWLDINANHVMRAQNFASAEAIVMRTGTAPDGVAVDVAGGKIYWTNMGSLLGTGGGTLQRANLDGSEVETIVPAGVAQTPKQMQLDLTNRHVYWCDREGAKVWRAGMDGKNPEAIVSEHGFRELVGVALDVPAGKFYFSDRIGQKILRANLQLPAGETGANRTDIEEQLILSGSAMPIDLDIDHMHEFVYWTDRDLGTVSRMGLHLPTGQTAASRSDAKTLVTGLVETIGISLDVPNNKMYFSELGCQVSESALDGSGLKRGILRSGSATGVALAHIPKP